MALNQAWRLRSHRLPVVVLRALGLGDLLTAVPALRAVARAHPDVPLRLAAPPPLAPLLGLIDPGYVLVPAAPLGPLPESLCRSSLAVNLHGRGPQSHRVLLDSAPQRLIAFANPQISASRDMPPWQEDEHEVDRWCRLVGGFGMHPDPKDLALGSPGPGPEEALGATVIHVGAACAARRWPVHRWAGVARAERGSGRSVVLTGSPSEVGLARIVAEQAEIPGDHVLAGRTDLLALARVVAGAGRVLSTDTGVAHLAVAFGVPTVTLFGPTSPAHWGPPADRPWHRVLWSGRRGDPQAQRLDPGLLEIDVEDVVEASESLPNPGATPTWRRERLAG